MKELIVQTKNRTYPIIISNKFNAISNYFKTKSNRCVIITDHNVGMLYLSSFIADMKDSFKDIYSYVFESGEQSKSLEEVKKIYQFMLNKKIDRDDILIALGGGVTGDLAGFAAATYLRGIKLIQVPTTLLSQVDSSVGGKTAVNCLQVKNAVGAFYQPVQVQINYSVLKSLPINEIRNGLVEILVHAIIKDEQLFAFIEKKLNEIEMLDPTVMEQLIFRNCQIKQEVIQRDERDMGERMIFNFGHTYGHAIESSYKYNYKHGECVAIGIIGACYIAEKLKLIESTVTNRIKDLLKRMQVLNTIHDCNKREILEFIMHDKKTRGGKVFFVLPYSIGNVGQFEINQFSLIEEVLDMLSEEEWS